MSFGSTLLPSGLVKAYRILVDGRADSEVGSTPGIWASQNGTRALSALNSVALHTETLSGSAELSLDPSREPKRLKMVRPSSIFSAKTLKSGVLSLVKRFEARN